MNPKELKDYLYQIARNQGEKALTQDEVEFMNGRITYQTYQKRCYDQYCQGNLTKKKPPIK